MTDETEPKSLDIRRRSKLGVIITATVLGLFFIAVITMYVLSL